MSERAWRKTRLADALARIDVRERLREALAAGPLCDHCLGRLLAEVDTGLANQDRGRIIRSTLGAPPEREGVCGVCDGLFSRIEAWAARAKEALAAWEYEHLAVSSHTDPEILRREKSLWQLVGGDYAEPYKQSFNRALGIRLCDLLGKEVDLRNPDVIVLADHAGPAGAGSPAVTVRIEPLFAGGRYRKLARGIPQCRWRPFPTSVQQIVGDPVCRAAEGQDHCFHGCGREDVDVRCLGERPFVLEVARPRRRRLDWAALTQEINASGQVEVLGLARSVRSEVARLKELHPEKSYRALVRLAGDVDGPRLARLAGLVGDIAQQTPVRVLRRRADLCRRRRLVSIEWRRIDPRRLELAVRTQAGLYVKELVSGDSGRTHPSVAEVLGVAAECEELDVLAVHVEGP